ncbi:hypothetical protein CRM22_007275 [Opisthorchis felineus]|nr:hypothetical protein CRM22_007275 [Opisthorchis felineus]TGZ62757.1 hypothetical protein CRM22_007275 [Opisthorchis felineus]
MFLHPIYLNTSHPIAAVACGWDFTLCLTNDGQLIGFGSNMHGQILGAPTPSHSVQPFRVTVPRVQMVSAGLRHALVVSADGEVLSWGANRRGQLGGTSISDVVRFTFNRLYGKPVCCSAGAQHSVVATDKGYVLVFGDLRYFHGPQAVDEPRAEGESRCLSFSRHLFGGRPVVQVASGWSHIVGRTDAGEVYTWGRADLGQLGRPTYPSVDSVGPRYDPTPGLVVFDDSENGRPVKIVDVAAGSEHSMALDENGRIWTWGWNEHGMCGILSVTDSDESGDHPLHGCLQRPTCVTFPSSNTYQSLRDPKAIAIGAGYGHSLAFVY